MALQRTSGGGLLITTGGALAKSCCCAAPCTTATCQEEILNFAIANITCPLMDLRVSGASGTITWCGETWNLPADSGKCKKVCPTFYKFTKINRYQTYTNYPCYRYNSTHTPSPSYISYTTFNVDQHIFGEYWKHNNGIVMFRDAVSNTQGPLGGYCHPSPGGCRFHAGQHGLILFSGDPRYQKDHVFFYGTLTPAAPTYFCGIFTGSNNSNSTIGKVTTAVGVGKPNYNDFRLTKQNFFSYCGTGSGALGFRCTGTPTTCTKSGYVINGITYHWEKGSIWP